MTTIADIDPESGDITDTIAEEPVVKSIDDHEAVFEALASNTARQIVSTLAESTATATELAVATDTSLQNVHYHLKRLESADVIETVGISYSSRGLEMDVYDLSGSPLIFVL